MITLNVSTDQEAFDKVVRHLATMPRQSFNRDIGVCVYRSPDGLKCAVGCLFDDDQYDPDIESELAETVVGDGQGVSLDLLADLQGLHDVAYFWGDNGFNAWREARSTAHTHGLDASVVDEVAS